MFGGICDDPFSKLMDGMASLFVLAFEIILCARRLPLDEPIGVFVSSCCVTYLDGQYVGVPGDKDIATVGLEFDERLLIRTVKIIHSAWYI